MATDVALSKAQFVCIALETYLYGLYTVLVTLTIWLLLTRRKRDGTTVMIVLHTMLMFAICTGHVGIILEYMFSIFLQQNVAVDSGIIPTLDDRFLAFLILLFLNCIFGDLIVIWRVWVIWGRNKKAVAVPAILWAASLVTFAGSVYALSRPRGIWREEGLVVSPWVAVFMSMSLSTNLTAVIAVSYRYLEVISVLRRHGGDLGVACAFTLIIESGSLYCVIWSVLLAAYVTSNRTLDTTLLASVAILTAMYPSLIIVLICLRQSQAQQTDRLLYLKGD
ncbi:hypothetical protein BC629DRAFT_1586657 [Irpex lacteus]|nr:hypothetical protein BC629DRAFT_1586657 [Irpex lacteus]